MRALFTFLVATFYTSIAYSQPYTFTQSANSYANLVGATSINGNVVWGPFDSHTVPIGFTFQFMGNGYTTIYIEGSGFTRLDQNYFFLINPFTVALKDKGINSSLSPLTYKLEGSAPNRILKIEWSNCEFVNDLGSTANFQLWLYETSNIIESHIGNCTVNNPANAYSANGSNGPVIAIYQFQTVTTCIYGLALNGPSAAANDTLFQNTNVDIFDHSLSSTPVSGTVYRFSPLIAGIDNIERKAELNIYPNPFEKFVLIQSSNPEVFDILLYSVDGKLVLKTKSKSNEPVFLNELKPGIYFMEIQFYNKVIRRKVIKS